MLGSGREEVDAQKNSKRHGRKEEVFSIQDGKHFLVHFERLCFVSTKASSCLLLVACHKERWVMLEKEELQIRIDAGDKKLVAEEKAWCTEHIN